MMSALKAEARSVTSNPKEFWSRFVQPRIAHIQHVSSLGSSNLVADARRTLDNELEALHLAICYLHSSRHALSLVSGLPDEVLARIFKFTAATMPPTHRSGSRLGWISLTHVCRRWRDVALNHASLWASITDELSPWWRGEMLSRAKSAPISIHFPFCQPEKTTFIVQHMSRTHELQVGLRSNDLKTFCDSLTSSPATALKSLEMMNWICDIPVKLPTNMFDGHTPLLRRLTLEHAFFPWDAPVFRTLADLENSHKAFAEPISAAVALDSEFDHFLRAFENMPTLERLMLFFCLPSSSQISAIPKTVVLPRLKELSLSYFMKECINFVRHLIIPSSCHIALECWGDMQPIDGLLCFLDAYTHEQEPLRTLSIHLPLHGRSSFVIVKLWRAFRHVTIPDEDREDRPLIDISFPVSRDSLDVLEELLAALPLQHLRSIAVLTDHPHWSLQCWRRIFGRCGSVEHVFVKGCYAPYLFGALIPLADEDRKTLLRPDRFFSRRLKSLHVADVDFRKFYDFLQEDCYVVLYLGLRMRKRRVESAGLGESGSGVDGRLERLVITDCDVPVDCLEELGAVVRALEWDGKGSCTERDEKNGGND